MITTEDRTEASTLAVTPDTSSNPNQPAMKKDDVEKEAAATAQPPRADQKGQEKLMDLKTVLVLISVLSGVFLVALDRSIISTVSTSYTHSKLLTDHHRPFQQLRMSSTRSLDTAGTDPLIC